MGDPVDEEKSGKVLGYFILYADEVHGEMIERWKTAKEAWAGLEALYKAKSKANLVQLKKQFNALQLLAGLPAEYNNITSIIENRTDDPTMDQVLAALILEEQKIGRQNDPLEATALMAKVKDWKADKRCNHCKEPGHFKRECPK
ncbi:hypothetical protein GPECTOR_221g477 [Gonium pectorale]|uniref:CCHC-type domain-containing protein n=1 Tax=Gonium pectorale TaxID=33097 RepID=A0A150FWP4_GONPE|nr:hypothetical protein GPECTOR_221g477 [Gonium pectorale]|eukprot:KXZ42019.1 hypothetical protein GPECTOR_221g477 [Gonium pectorale]